MSLTSIKAKKPKNHGERALKSVAHEKNDFGFFYEPKMLLGSHLGLSTSSRENRYGGTWPFSDIFDFQGPLCKIFKNFFFLIFNSGHYA